jgi:hypothetical protein
MVLRRSERPFAAIAKSAMGEFIPRGSSFSPQRPHQSPHQERRSTIGRLWEAYTNMVRCGFLPLEGKQPLLSALEGTGQN